MKSWLTLRHALGALCLLQFFRGAGAFFHSGAAQAGAGGAMLLMSWLVLAAVLFSRRLSESFARPFNRFIDAVYFGPSGGDPPPVTLRLARAYRSQCRYRDAMDECGRQLEFHPRSVELWGEILRNAKSLGDERELARVIARARRRLRAGDRESLAREFPGL